MLQKPLLATISISLLLAMTTACITTNEDVQDFIMWSENNRPDGVQKIRVTGIEVKNEDDASFLEIEVHIFDANTGQLLGCCGGINGLLNVDRSDVHYSVNANFSKPDYSFLTLADVEDKTVYLMVIEDDLEQCPGPITSLDDLIGRSGNFCGCDLATRQVMSFGDVVSLEIGI
jgi:hypothetical protein